MVDLPTATEPASLAPAQPSPEPQRIASAAIVPLREAAEHFAIGRRALDEARAGEILAEELRLSQQALGTITGAVSADDLLGKIFSAFCIGK